MKERNETKQLSAPDANTGAKEEGEELSDQERERERESSKDDIGNWEDTCFSDCVGSVYLLVQTDSFIPCVTYQRSRLRGFRL